MDTEFDRQCTAGETRSHVDLERGDQAMDLSRAVVGKADPSVEAVKRTARSLAFKYQLVIQREPQHQFMAHCREMPGIIAHNPSPMLCKGQLRRRLVEALTDMLLTGRTPPQPGDEPLVVRGPWQGAGSPPAERQKLLERVRDLVAAYHYEVFPLDGKSYRAVCHEIPDLVAESRHKKACLSSIQRGVAIAVTLILIRGEIPPTRHN